MNPSRILVLTLLCLIFFSCVSGTKQKYEGKKPPNIIFILSDDQAWGDYGFMDHPYIQTPNIIHGSICMHIVFQNINVS